jgi:hypothetical protein
MSDLFNPFHMATEIEIQKERIAALEARIAEQVDVMRQAQDFIDYIAITNAAQRMLDLLDDTIKKEMP